MPVPGPAGRCWQELWGFSRASGWLGGPGKRTFAPSDVSSGHPTRPLASHVLAMQGIADFCLSLQSPPFEPLPIGTPLLWPVGRAGGGFGFLVASYSNLFLKVGDACCEHPIFPGLPPLGPDVGVPRAEGPLGLLGVFWGTVGPPPAQKWRVN